MIEVEVVYAQSASKQALYRLRLEDGATIEEAVRVSGVLEAFPELRGELKVGVYAKLAAGDTVLRDEDRVEIYRPLVVDPKEARRLRAQKRARK